MHGLLYRSRARPGLSAGDLNDIIATAEAENAAHDVTGLLLYGQLAMIPGAPGEFVQWIEGSEAAVASLYQELEADPRHFDLTVMGQGHVSHLVRASGCALVGGRLFPSWSMGLVRMSELPATLRGFLTFVRDWDRQLEPA